MKDKKFTEDEAYSLVRHEQMAILDLRSVKFKSNLNESGLVKLILSSNTKVASIPLPNQSNLVLSIPAKDINLFKEILTIARAGFPSQDLITFIDLLAQNFK